MTTGTITLAPSVDGETEVITLSSEAEEFHLLGQHDQLKHAPGGSEGEGGINAAKVAAAIGAVVVGAGLVYYTQKKAPGSFRYGEAGRRSHSLEDIVEKGGPDLDLAIKGKIDALRAGKNVDRNAKDLKILMDNEYIDPNDTGGFLKKLNKNKYTDQDVDALWEYAGVYRDADKPGGDITKGAFKWNRKFRNGIPLSNAESKQANALDTAIKRNTLPHDVTLFRGMPATDAERRKWASVKPGYIITDKAPIFTGLTESRANPHYMADVLPTSLKYRPGRANPVLFIIDAPKGLPAVSSPYGHGLARKKIPIPPSVKILGKERRIPGASTTELKLPWMKHFNKEEIVLRRKQPLRVVSSEERADGVLVVHVVADIAM